MPFQSRFDLPDPEPVRQPVRPVGVALAMASATLDPDAWVREVMRVSEETTAMRQAHAEANDRKANDDVG